MNPVKFKAWLKYEERMEVVGNIDFITGDVGLLGDDGEIVEWRYKHDYVLLPYTGRKDDYDREIYQGNIIHAKGHFNGVGWFDTGECDYDFINIVEWDENQLTFVCGGFHLYELDEVEILGNVFEDFHLLNNR